MHTTIRLKGQPIIILSEDLTELMASNLKEWALARNYANNSMLIQYIEDLFEYSQLQPGQGYPFDAADFFQSAPDELAHFIELLSNFIASAEADGTIAEVPILKSYQEHLVKYLHELQTSQAVE